MYEIIADDMPWNQPCRGEYVGNVWGIGEQFLADGVRCYAVECTSLIAEIKLWAGELWAGQV